ncbi:MAG: serine/threonine protein kinase [Oscillospiraceae bacterium]|nr:serine/threonine protein kinase [Oscillospiraceae bacterium]
MDETRYCPYCMTPVNENGVCPACGLTEGSYVPAPHHLLPGTVLQDRYLIGRVLGEGGFGITYVGRDTRLGVKIAVKEYYPVGNAARNNLESITVSSSSRTTGTYEKGKSKFLQEARTMGKLEKDPHIVSVKDYFQENNTAYIVMEYIEGTTLKELTKQRGGRIPADELFDMIKPMFGAIHHMHALGLIHRDISPDNLMLENGDIKLLDFGCAKDVTDSTQVNQQTQTLILKHGYSPFEQYQMSSYQGPWTDVYAFGASIYYCLTGNAPPRSTDRIMEDNITPPHKLGVKINDRQEDALMKALAVRPADRFKTMKEFYGALYNTETTTAEAVQTPEKPVKRAPTPAVRRKRDKKLTGMEKTVRERLFETPEVPEEPTSEQAMEPATPFSVTAPVTDDVAITEAQVNDSTEDRPAPEEESKPSKKPLIIAVIAIIIVIVLAAVGIVFAVVGTGSGENSGGQSGYSTENWLPIEGVSIGTYQEGEVSYDAYTRTITYDASYSAIGWDFTDEVYLEYIKIYFSDMYTLKLEVTYADGTTVGNTADTGYTFGTSLSLTLDPTKPIAHIALVNAAESGEFSLISVTYRVGSTEAEAEEIADINSGIEQEVETATEVFESSPITNHWIVCVRGYTEDWNVWYTGDDSGIGNLELEFTIQDLMYSPYGIDNIRALDGFEIVIGNVMSMDEGATFRYNVYVNDELIISKSATIEVEGYESSIVGRVTNLEAHVIGDYDFSVDDVVRIEVYNVVMDEAEVSYPWVLTETDGVVDQYGNRLTVRAIDGLTAGEQYTEMDGQFLLGNAVFMHEWGDLWREFVAAVTGENTYLEITSYDLPDEFMLFVRFRNDGYAWLVLHTVYDYEESEPIITVTVNDDGTYTYSISCADLLDAIERNGYSIYDINTVSVQCDEGTVFKSFEVVSRVDTEVVGGEANVSYSSTVAGEVVELEITSTYEYQLKELTVTDSDGNALEVTAVAFERGTTDVWADTLRYTYSFVMPDSKVTVTVEMFDSEISGDFLTVAESNWYDLELSILDENDVEFSDENLYLCIYYDEKRATEGYEVGVIYVGDENGDNAQVYHLTYSDSGYIYVPLTVLKSRAEELGWSVSDGFFFYTGNKLADEDGVYKVALVELQ